MSARYEVRVVGADDYTRLGRAVAAAEDLAEAKQLAFKEASYWRYGVAVLDTVEHTVDWGDELTPATRVAIDGDD